MFSIYKKKTPKGDKRNVEIMAHFHAVVAEKKFPFSHFTLLITLNLGCFRCNLLSGAHYCCSLLLERTDLLRSWRVQEDSPVKMMMLDVLQFPTGDN